MVKNPPANAGDTGSIPGLERSPAEGNCNPLQYSCLGNPMDRGAWWATRVRHDLATKQQCTTEIKNSYSEQVQSNSSKFLVHF